MRHGHGDATRQRAHGTRVETTLDARARARRTTDHNARGSRPPAPHGRPTPDPVAPPLFGSVPAFRFASLTPPVSRVRAAPHASDVNGRTPYPERTATSPNPLNLQIESPSTTEGKGDHRDPRIHVCRLKLMHAALSSLRAPHRRLLDEKVFAGRGGVNHLPPPLLWGRRSEGASRPTAVGCSRRALRARRGGAKDLRRA